MEKKRTDIITDRKKQIMDKKFSLERYARRMLLLAFDIACFVFLAVLIYIALRVFSSGWKSELRTYTINSLILLLTIFTFRLLFRVYSTVWRYTSTRAYFSLVLADFFGGCAAVLIARAIGTYRGVWPFLNEASLCALLALTARFAYRLLYKYKNRARTHTEKIPVAIIGAGQTGVLLAGELLENKSALYRPMFFVDVNPDKVGGYVCGLPVYHEDERIYKRIREMEIAEIHIAIVPMDGEKMAKLYDFYRETGCKIKLYDIPLRDPSENGEENAAGQKRQIRELQIEDLLFRDPLSFVSKDASQYYENKVVLVTGGGGSIGSELCRQIAKCHPKQLIIFEIYENNAYEIQQELGRTYKDKLDLRVEIGSVRDRARLDAVFAYYRPQVVFHAAAHKHVPLMEHSGCEAIKNNVLGTYNSADMAEKYGVEKFILISTDKAVNPTNIMGASKRLCEMVIQCRADSKTNFAAVRFGNVLGSNGSVIPLFKKQIAAGGPVTITDKRIIRYFMTIPEASQLVMQAGAMAQRGELFVLDMGKPVRIYDLAVNMIRLSGLVPNVDIKIEEIGLRPGEKLYEELLMRSDTLEKTDNNMIFVERCEPMTRGEVEEKLSILRAAVADSAAEIAAPAIREAMMQVVPTFHDPEEVNCNAEATQEMQMSGVVAAGVH